jgi:hypothetical protein
MNANRITFSRSSSSTTPALSKHVNTNRIKRDGFSNPDTERFYQEPWTEEGPDQEGEEGKICGLCSQGTFLLPSEYPWVLCLNPDSPYCYETVDPIFYCPRHKPWPETSDEQGGKDEEQGARGGMSGE